MSGKIKLVSVALALALSVPAMAADMPGVTPRKSRSAGLSLQRTRLVDRARRPGNSRLRAVRQRPWRDQRTQDQLHRLRRCLQPAKGGRACPQTCRRRRGCFRIQPVGYARKFGDGKIPDLQESSGHRHRFRLEQVHQCHELPADDDQPRQLRYRRKNLRQISDQDSSEREYAILYQNDDLGKDYVNAFKALLKSDFDKKVVAAAYEIADPTVDSQVVNLKSSGAEALLVAGTPKFAAQAIRKAFEIGWKPTILLNYPLSSVGATLKPAALTSPPGSLSEPSPWIRRIRSGTTTRG